MNKVCTNCKVEKNIDCFNKRSAVSDGLSCWCKFCARKYRLDNKTKVKEYSKNYYVINRDKLKVKGAVYRENNKRKDYFKKYRKDNKEKLTKYNIAWIAAKKEKSSVYKLRCLLSNLIGTSLRRRCYKKNSATESVVGCRYTFLYGHLMISFYNNYGKLPTDQDNLHVDHIIPLATAETEEEILKLNHYTNLQWLLAEDNLKKSNKIGWKVGD